MAACGAARDYGPWTDLYAVGCIAYWLVTGRRPFEERDELTLAQRHLHEAPAPLPAGTTDADLRAAVAEARRLIDAEAQARYRDEWAWVEKIGAPAFASVSSVRDSC